MRKSLNFKWAILFTSIVIISQLVNFVFISHFFIPTILAEINNQLELKCSLLVELHNMGTDISEGIVGKIAGSDYDYRLFTREQFIEKPENYSYVTLDMIDTIEQSQIIHFIYSPHRDTMEDKGNKDNLLNSGLIYLDNSYIILTPSFKETGVAILFKNLLGAAVLGALIGSVIIVMVLRIIIKPIKKITQATTEVAKGNFDIKLEAKTLDEIGQLIDNFNKMTKELQNIENLRKDFVSSVSHEFKTPITSITGFLYLLKSQTLSVDEFNEYIDIIIRETKRLSNLSSNLLMLSQLDNKNFDIKKIDFSLDEQVRNAILLLENHWQLKNIDFDIEMDDVIIHSSDELLMQVWINILQNAIKFSKENTEIKVIVKDMDTKIKIEITDFGIGISEEEIKKIFGRFYKADKSRSMMGNGLGLSIVKEIIELLDGSIKCKSVLDGYTTFVISLPK